MRKIQLYVCLPLMLLLMQAFSLRAADTLFVREKQVPVLIEREDNVLFELKITATDARKLDEIVLDFGERTALKHIRAVKLYYAGTETRTYRQDAFHPVEYISSMDPGNTLKANPSYSILLQKVRRLRRQVTLKADQPLFPGVNYFWVSLEMKHRKTKLADVVTAVVSSAKIDGSAARLAAVSPQGIVHRMGIGVRKAGDDGSKAYRIPGLVTTNDGTLLAVYDVRYNNSKDLQEHIDIGLSRSTDGGRTWEKMRRPIAFGERGGLPLAQNGAGDPAILVDKTSGDVWIASIWTHGMGVATAWWSTVPGISAAAGASPKASPRSSRIPPGLSSSKVRAGASPRPTGRLSLRCSTRSLTKAARRTPVSSTAGTTGRPGSATSPPRIPRRKPRWLNSPTER